MIRATRTTSYDTNTETQSSPSSTSTPTQPSFRDPYTSNPTNAIPTLTNTSNTNTAPPPKPPTALHHSPPTPLFRPTFTVWWGPVEAIVVHFKQTTDSTGHPSLLYQLLLPSGITRTVEETRLETYAPTAPLSHSTAPTPYPPFHVPDVTPLTVFPSLPPSPAQPQLPSPPTHALPLPHPKFTPQPTLSPRPIPTSRPSVTSQKPFEQPIQKIVSLHSFMYAM